MLAPALQHYKATLLAGLSTAGTRGMADKQQGAWRSGNRYALSTSPHPRRRLSELRGDCATLTHHWHKTSGSPRFIGLQHVTLRPKNNKSHYRDRTIPAAYCFCKNMH